jgi:hypothetical protein
MVRKVFKVDSMFCPKCDGTVKVIAFITEFGTKDRIIKDLELTFVAEKPPTCVFEQIALMAADGRVKYFSNL